MISDLLKDLNVDCNFTNDIKESNYIEGSKNKNENISESLFYIFLTN